MPILNIYDLVPLSNFEKLDTRFSTWARKNKKAFQVLTIDCFSSLSCLFTSGGFLPSSSLISRSYSFINLKPLTFHILRMQVTYSKSKLQNMPKSQEISLLSAIWCIETGKINSTLSNQRIGKQIGSMINNKITIHFFS